MDSVCFSSLLNSSVSPILARCISFWFITVTEPCNKAFPCFTPLFSPLNYTSFQFCSSLSNVFTLGYTRVIHHSFSAHSSQFLPEHPLYPGLVIFFLIFSLSWDLKRVCLEPLARCRQDLGSWSAGPAQLGQQNRLNVHREEICWVRRCQL